MEQERTIKQNTMQIYTIITAGGIGTRMGTGIPKQFLQLSGKPILMHTFERFYDYDPGIRFILTLPEEFISYWNELCVKYKFTIKHEIASGGETRFHSIKNALRLIADPGFVAVHDGVRPLVSAGTILKAFCTAEQYGNAVVSQKIPFSIRMLEADGNRSVDRRAFVEIQTPQIFDSELLKKAYEQAYTPLFTDDASVVEAMGEKIHLTEGNPENIKITNHTDFIIAEALLSHIQTNSYDQ